MNSKKREMILNLLAGLLEFNMNTCMKLLRRFKKNPEQFYMESACRVLENTEYDMSFRIKPKNRKIHDEFLYHIEQDKFAIIMQGPIRTQDDYTARTIRYYKNMYPQAVVIVSTWNDEETSAITKIKEIADFVVQSEKPDYSGHLNINFQLVNTYAGIKKAEALGVKYVAKTRTDQCIVKPHAFEYVINLLNTFSTDNQEHQEKRVVCLSMNYGNMFFPYFMSDFFYMGTIKDMDSLLGVELDRRPKFKMPENSTRRAYAQIMDAPEVYIMKHYLMKIGYNGDGSIKDYWRAVKESLICVDMKMLDLDWPKYDGKYSLHSFYGDFFWDDTVKKKKTVNFDFVNWFNLYSGSLLYKPEYEKYADVIFK